MTAATDRWHAEPADRVLEALGTSADGLKSSAADARLREVGPNRLPAARGPSALALLGRRLRSPLIGALVAAGAVAVALGELEDGVVVLAVVVLNTLIGFVQEYRAGRAIAALAALAADPATVRRDGAWVQLPAARLVPGDVVTVAQGERIAADLRVLGAESLRAQESALTGESEPVDKDPAPAPAAAPPAARNSLLHAGTVVAAGSGRGVVVATGAVQTTARCSARARSATTRAARRTGRCSATRPRPRCSRQPTPPASASRTSALRIHGSARYVYAGIAAVLALQALFVYAPFMHDVFGSAPLGARQLGWAALAATAILPVTAREERARRRAARRPS